mgnify:CR=1 FL=1
MTYQTVIWLEIHIKLNSKNKLFCRCANMQEFDDVEPNTNICPVCTGQPGALPVINQSPLDKAIQLWLAIWCTVDQQSFFDRKSYFYPDLPMWYQITQLARPTNIDGEVSFFVDKEFDESRTVGIRDAHIEIDTAKSNHQWDAVLLDFNRSGTPLVEIVSHPDFRTADEVVAFLKQLQRIARYNNVGDADMEKGQLRVDVNISLRPEWQEEYGTRTETKNMNSFSAITRAIAYEVVRQTEVLEQGWHIDQETRGRDDATGTSYVMRSKENAMDYRYFPEPDLPPLDLSDVYVADMAATVDEWPYARILKYKTDYKFNKEYINALINDVAMNTYFGQTVADGLDPSETAKRLVWPIQRWLTAQETSLNQVKFSREQYVDFLRLISDGSLANAQAKIVITEMLETGADPSQIIQDKWLKPVGEEEISARLDQIFWDKPDLLEDLQSGNMKPMWFVVGQVMKLSGGAADPGVVNGLIKKRIK